MPSKSKKQHNFMAMMAHTGTPKMRKVAYDFLRADAGKFSSKTKPKNTKPTSRNPKKRKK